MRKGKSLQSRRRMYFLCCCLFFFISLVLAVFSPFWFSTLIWFFFWEILLNCWLPVMNLHCQWDLNILEEFFHGVGALLRQESLPSQKELSCFHVRCSIVNFFLLCFLKCCSIALWPFSPLHLVVLSHTKCSMKFIIRGFSPVKAAVKSSLKAVLALAWQNTQDYLSKQPDDGENSVLGCWTPTLITDCLMLIAKSDKKSKQDEEDSCNPSGTTDTCRNTVFHFAFSILENNCQGSWVRVLLTAVWLLVCKKAR